MTRTAVISQPTYLPYLGYLELIARADVFVFLDDVQFARRSWQSRNRVPDGRGGELMLTVPVRKMERDVLVRDVVVDDGQPWRNRHLNSLRNLYARRPGYGEGIAFLDEQLNRPSGLLSELNIALISAAARRLELKAELLRASELDCGGGRSQHLLNLCRAAGATAYLSTTGSADYMAEEGVFEAARFPVRFHSHAPRPYPQGREPFTPYMSFVDSLMNLGWDGLRALIAEGSG